MQRAVWIGGCAAAVLSSALVVYWQWPAPTPVAVLPAPVLSAPNISPAPVAPAPVAVAPARSKSAAIVPGMADTEVDGALMVDAAGNLVLDLAVRDYLDYFLSAADQAGIDAAVDSMLADARLRLQEPALGQFVSLLGDYLAYKEASIALLSQPLTAQQQASSAGQLDALKQGMSMLDNLRRSHFSPAAHSALFGAEEAYAEYTLGVMALQQRSDLSDTQKQQAEQQLRASLPQSMQSTHAQQAQDMAVQTRTRELFAANAPEAEVRQYLAQHYDAPTVELLVKEQRAEQQWSSQYQQYRDELSRLRSSGLAAQDQAKEQQRLRQQWFPEEQWHKVETYDAFNDQSAEGSASPAS